MRTVKDILSKLEERIPPALAESWDAVGLQVGDPNAEVTGIVTTLDVTMETVEHAIVQKANLIVSHHPLLFGGLRRVDLSTAQGALVGRLIRENISVYSAHTNLDIVAGGLNDWVAERLGLQDVTGLAHRGQEEYVKIAVFVPETHVTEVRIAMGDAGAGALDGYSHCSFSIKGTGRYIPLEGAHPYKGKVGVLERVPEERIEAIAPRSKVQEILEAMRAVHPYEVVAYDVYPILEPIAPYALGRVGNYPMPIAKNVFYERLQSAFPEAKFRFAGTVPQEVQRVALCTGSGAEFMKEAKAAGADVYITGDVKYHDAQRACELDMLVVDAGHYGTECIAAEGLADILRGLVEDGIPVHAYKGRDFFLPEETLHGGIHL